MCAITRKPDQIERSGNRIGGCRAAAEGAMLLSLAGIDAARGRPFILPPAPKIVVA
jgi:hypothetical protein